MTSVVTVVDTLFENFSLQFQAYDELVALATRELAILKDGITEPDGLQEVLDAKNRVIGRIDDLAHENRNLREKSATAWHLPELTLSALEQVGTSPYGQSASGRHTVDDVRRIVGQLAERMAALDELEQTVEDALLTVRHGMKDEMQRVHTGRGALGAYRKAAWRPSESHFMDSKR